MTAPGPGSSPGAAPTLRSRLTLAFVGVALGLLVVAGVVTIAFARVNARDAAQSGLRDQAEALGQFVTEEGFAPRVRRSLVRSLRLQDATVVRVTPEGLRGELPEGIDAADLDPEALRSGSIVEGERGSVVFVAYPVQDRRPRDAPPGAPGGGLSALVLTRDVDFVDFGGLGPWLLAAGGVALVAAGGIGAVLARRLTRPLAATEQAARAIAGGDLSARVGEAGRADRELAQVAAAFDDMADELERSRNLTRDFLMSVSHDLRTPLTSIRGYAEAIAEGTVTRKADRQRAAGVIEGEARRLERLVSDLLDLARLDAGRFTLEPAPVNAGAVARTVASGFERLAAEHGVTLDVDAPDLPAHDLDADRLGQVVANLVENALRYADATVAVSVAADEGAVVMEIADDGPGVDKEDLPRVFERLYTGRAVEGRAVGTGLGLAIVHELVEAMGGSVTAVSPPTGGARFTVTLP